MGISPSRSTDAVDCDRVRESHFDDGKSMTSPEHGPVVRRIREIVIAGGSWKKMKNRVAAAYGESFVAQAAALAVELHGSSWVGDDLVLLEVPRPRPTAPPERQKSLSDSDNLRIAFSLLKKSEQNFLTQLDLTLVPFRSYTIEWIRAPESSPSQVRAWCTAAAEFVRSTDFKNAQDELRRRIAGAKQDEEERARRESAALVSLRDVQVAAKERVSRSNWTGARDEPSTEWWREQE